MAPKQQQKKNAAATATAAKSASAPAAAAAAAGSMPAAAAVYDKKSNPPVAVIIADSFTDELKPLTQQRPRALLPVGNTPLIEYALELLVVNGFREVRVVTYFCSDELERHLRTTVTYTGKSWLNSTEINVQLIRGSAGTQSLKQALIDVSHKNMLPDTFLLLPVDTLTTCRNLAEIFHNHNRRAQVDSKFVMTIGVVEAPTPLIDAHESCVERAIEANQGVQSPATILSNVGGDFCTAPASLRAAQKSDVVSLATDQEYVTIAYRPQQHNAVVGYQSWAQNEREIEMKLGQRVTRQFLDSRPGTVVENSRVYFDLTSKSDTVVRTDLICPGVLVMSQSFVSTVLQEQFMAMATGVDDFIKYFVGNNATCNELCAVDFLSDDSLGHVSAFNEPVLGTTLLAAGGCRKMLGMSDTTSSSSPAVSEFNRLFLRSNAMQRCLVVPVRSVATYVSAGIAVCERRVFPFTRESNFADKEPFYAVWRHLPNVYVHVNQNFRLSASMELGPNAVVGEGCDIHPSAIVVGSALGNRCRIGAGAVVLHSVLMDDVVIGDRVQVSHSAFGVGVQLLADSLVLNEAVAGDGVVVTARSNGAPPQWPPGTRVHVPSTARTPEASRQTDLVGAKGTGEAMPLNATQMGARLPLDALFTRDAVERTTSDDSGEDPNEAMLGMVEAEMSTAVASEAMLPDLVRKWRMDMIAKERRIEDLLRAVTQALIVHVCEHNKGQDAKVIVEALKTVIAKWCHPVFLELIHKKTMEHMYGVLRGFALALAQPACEPIRKRAAHVLSAFYAEADPQRFDDKGYCIVSFKAIDSFDDLLLHQAEVLAGAYDEEELREGWKFVAKYVGQLRQA